MLMSALLHPITSGQPAGEDLSFSTEFDTIRGLREQDDPSLDQGAWVTALKVADWPGVLAESERLLGRRSKDLRLAGWRLEALGHLQGLPGLAQGLEDSASLCEAFWTELHPQGCDGDWDERSGSLRWLLQALEQGLGSAPLLGQGKQRYSLADMAEARHWAQKLERDPHLQADERQPTPERIARALRDTPAAGLREQLAALDRLDAQLQRLQAWVEPAMQGEAPSFARARDALGEARRQLERLARDNGALPPPAGAAAPLAQPAGAGEPAAAAAVASAATGLHSREQALAQLRQVADYFRRTEPHSPVAYLADKAARWGEMPLHEWLRQVVKDGAALGQLEELLGTERPDPQS